MAPIANVDDILADALASCVLDFFQPGSSHIFFNVATISVPDKLKPIPRRWIEDVELGEGFGGEEVDILGDGPTIGWGTEECKKRLRDALARLDLREETLRDAELYRFGKNELGHEKKRVKQELKRYDSDFKRAFQRLPTHAEKEPMRPLYAYYRRLKGMIAKAEQGRGPGAGGAPGRRPSSAAANSDDEDDDKRRGPSARESLAGDENDSGFAGNRNARDQIVSLEARLVSLQNEKSLVRAKLQAFQEKFVAENNRKIRFHKDILPIERQYRNYKSLKDAITKVENQLRDLKMSQ